MIKKITLLLILISYYVYPQTAPVLYYDFDQTNPLSPRVGTGNLSTTNAYAITAGDVGNCLDLSDKTGSTYGYMIGGSVTPVTGYTIQMLIKPGHYFLFGRDNYLFFHGNNAAKFQIPYGGSLYFTLSFETRVNNVTHNQVFNFTGINRASLSWLLDSAWHHIAFTLNATNGVKQIYIDGLKVSDATGATGSITPNADQRLYLNTNTDYTQYSGNLDEIAIYTSVLTPQQIYKNYQDFIAGNHYTTANASSVPSVPQLTAPLDTLDFPYGYVLGSVNSKNCSNSAYTQFGQMKYPRYARTHSLSPMINWGAPNYFGGLWQTDIANPVEESGKLQERMVSKFKYSLLVSSNATGTSASDYADTTKFEGKWCAIAKRNPTWHTSIITLMNQLAGYISSKSNPPNYYLRNSSSQYIGLNGAVSGTKWLSPAAPATPLLNTDAVGTKTRIQSIKTAISPSTIDLVSENDEILYLMPTTTMLADPAVVTSFNSSGQPNYRAYLGSRYAIFIGNYRDTLLSILPGAKYLQYQMGAWDSTNGRNYYQINWSTYKAAQSNINGRKYSTSDMYTRYPENWRTWAAAWHGLQPVIESRYQEILQGDKVSAPFVAPGWDKNEELNMRPGRWLGLIKALHFTGVDFYHVGFFNDASFYTTAAPPPHPKGYAWQFAMPSFAQAIASRADTLCMFGNYISDTYAENTKTSVVDGLSLWSGDPRIYTVCKKDSSGRNEYVLSTTLQPHSNQKGQVEDYKLAKVKIGSTNYVFKTRQQGSTYLFNTDSATVIYLDEWHERIHPERWNRDLHIEFENYDLVSGAYFRHGRTKTYFSSNVSGGTKYFTEFTTAVRGNGLTDLMTYDLGFTEDTLYYLWVRARDMTVGTDDSIRLKIDITSSLRWNNLGSSEVFIMPVNTDTVWRWYRSGQVAGSIPTSGLFLDHNDDESLHPMQVYLGDGIEVDRFVFTIDEDTVYMPEGNGFGGGGSVPTYVDGILNIRQVGTLCEGDSVLLVATLRDTSGASGYDTIPVSDIPVLTWSNGKSGDSIYVYTAGSYSLYAQSVDYQPYVIGYDTIAVTSIACDTACFTPASYRIVTISKYNTRVRWTGNSSAEAYQIYTYDYALNKEFYTSSNPAYNTILIKNLRPNRNYKSKIRSFCNVNGSYVFSDWSDFIYWTTSP
jgi:hypothetical protein